MICCSSPLDVASTPPVLLQLSDVSKGDGAYSSVSSTLDPANVSRRPIGSGLNDQDALMIGNTDLRLSLHLPAGLDGPEPLYTQCIDQVLAAGKTNNQIVFTFTTGPESVAKRLEQGFKGFVAGNDGWGMAAMARGVLVQTSEVVKGVMSGVKNGL